MNKPATLFPSLVFLAAAASSGGAPEITALSRDTTGVTRIEVGARNDSYYILWRSSLADLATGWTAESVLAGPNGPLALASAVNTSPRGFYRVEEVPLTETTRDTDSDGMPDVFEIQYPGCLDGAVNDAAGDCDSDGLTNLQEFTGGTNPVVPNINSIPGLIINEVDYDQPGTDNAEFVEILNTSSSPINLTGISLVLLNGSTATAAQYGSVDLGTAGTLAPGQYLVVVPSSNTVTVPLGALAVHWSVTTNAVQNGAPDGIALINTTTQTVIDALSYEGSITSAQITGWTGLVSLVEGTVLAGTVLDTGVLGSLARLPNGSDTNDANTDWKFTATLTPGAANVP